MGFERRALEILESITDAFLTVARDWRFTYVNGAAEELLQRPRRELLGRTIWEAFPEAVGSIYEEQYRRAMEQGRTAQFEAYFEPLRIWTSVRAYPSPAGLSIYAQDITERKEAEEALRQSEDMLRQITENIREIFWMFDRDFTRTIYVSSAYEEIWGSSVESLYEDARSFLSGVHPEDVEDVRAAIARAGEGEPFRVEYRVVRADGSVRWAWSRGFPVFDDRGGVHRVVGTTEDVTQRKEAEAERAAAEAHYRRLVETSPYAIFALDREGRFTELNPAAIDLFGRGARELIGRSIAEIVLPEDLPRVDLRRADGIARDRDVVDRELRIVRPTGERRLIQVRSAVIRADGEVVGTHGIMRDVTEEHARQEEMHLLAAALESLDDGVSISRPDGRILYANSAHARLLGYERERGPLPNLDDFLPERERPAREEMGRIVAERGRWTGRVRRRRMDTGAIVTLEVIVERFDGQGGEPFLFAITRDVAAEIAKEQHLRRTERLASVGTLIGGVAHELNNPLHAIRNFAELLLMDERTAEDREAMEIIRREADRAARVVSDLRSIARETQESDGEREAVDLNDVIRHVLKVRRYSLETGNVAIRQDLAADLPPVWASRGELEQVFLNLVVNAEQALAGQKGKRELLLRTRHTPEGAAGHVEDTGPGIHPEHLERIFDPFFTTKAPGEGTGLGLSLVHSIVAEHGGRIQVESALGKGAAFRVDLPRAPTQVDTEIGDRSEPHPAQALRILVVDDEVSVRRASVRYLERMGHRVDAASEGEQALRYIEKADYDLIISDLRMPGLSGEGLLQRLRERGGGLERRLVFLTGDAAGARLSSELEVPVLIKPLRLEALANIIERLAGESRPVR